MVYIKGLKFRGFKSFRRAEASFVNGYVCLAGPNGSGKSNVTDGIRFALGEGSLKALRAKKVAELVNTSCKVAEVTLFIDGERQFEIKRAINSEGKTLYRINGKRSTRTLVMEELRQYGMEAGSHNIIAQGQVQKIVEMNAKERRQIIDGTAGIAEFDQKKAEALGELGAVEQKITEASIVLGEREANLSILEREKNDALAFTDSQTNFRRAKASMANAEHAKLNKSFTDAVQRHAAAKEALDEIAKQSAVLSGRISELEAAKKPIMEKIGSSASREAALAEIQEIKVSIGSGNATLSERKKELSKLEAGQKSSDSQLSSIKKAQKETEGKAAEISSQLEKLGQQIFGLEAAPGVQPGGASQEIAKRLEFITSEIMSLKEQRASVETSVSEKEKSLEGRREELQRMSSVLGTDEDARQEGEKGVLEKEVLSHQRALDALFDSEKQLNRQLPDLDRKLLSTKERAATLRANISPSAGSLALRAVEEMKSGGMRGIFGTVSSLVSCDAKYTTAIEAAAGQRLNYVVVDGTDTAISAIERLKAQKSGRCTFIPLDMPPRREDSGAASSAQKAAGCLGSLIEFVKYDAVYKKAMEYAFSETLLFDTVQSAKKAGVGKARMVTVEGELLERSGIITGGAQKGSLLSKGALDKLEAEAAAIEAERKEIYSRLYSIREEMSAKRKEKADAEVKLRGMEIEMESITAHRESRKLAREAISEIDGAIKASEKEIAGLRKRAAEISSKLEEAMSQHTREKEKQAAAEESAKKADSAAQKRLQALLSQRSSLEAQLSARNEEAGRLSSELSAKKSEADEAAKSLVACKKDMLEFAEKISQSEKALKEKEAHLSEISAASQKLMGKLSELESQVKDVATQLGKIRGEEDKRNREMVALDANRQIIEQRLSDIKAELDQYSGVPTIDASRAELEELARNSQAKMDALGNVNLRAPELYDQKKKDIDDVKSRVESLSGEKNAVLHMMDEIDARKRAIFLSTFTSVNDNFRKLFGFAFKGGEAALILEKPSSPFEGGLHVKVREENRDKYLDSMSGGEKSLVALMFIFAIQMHKAAPFYILDEADAALDKENSKKLADLIKQLSGKTQFIVVTHNDTVLSNSDVALGVTRTEDGSKIVGVQLTAMASVAKAKKA
ncbi:MAG: chromosome segregation SMC family protein [Candidatus Micrarchaeia archaeon]|jgi:chromosome segregation protein